MSKSFDEIMKVIEETGGIPDDKAKAIITEHGPLEADEKKQIATTIKMRKQLQGSAAQKKDDKPDTAKEGEDKPEAEAKEADKKADNEVTMDDYIQALSVLDAEDSTEDEKKKAQAVKEKFEA